MKCFDLKQKRDDIWLQLFEASHQQPFEVKAFSQALDSLRPIDQFWAYPGHDILLQLTYYLEREQYSLITQLVSNSWQSMQGGKHHLQVFRPFQTHLELLDKPCLRDDQQIESASAISRKPYFEVLVVHPYPQEYEALYRQQLSVFKTDHDEFLYDILFVDCAQDAITAILANPDIQACIYLNHVQPSTFASEPLFERYSHSLVLTTPPVLENQSIEFNLCKTIRCLRPELNHFLISEVSANDLPFYIRHQFDRVLFHIHPFHDLHLAILAGIRNRFSTPFFDALQAYSRQPKSVFHALPLSRGASVKGSPWIQDMLDFYGDGIFLSETSSTQGGLDSLLDPTGAIKQAHRKAAETFGADHSYFVTNGTSTSNKIVMQANVCPGDIVLISADCHKSVPYAVMLAGAYPIFLETYPLVDYDLYGGIDLAQIKAVMLDLQQQGRLHQLKQIVLTSSTFDGLIYHCEKFMMEILAIKPDVIFHWDEAWFACAHFHPLYHSRTAMSAVYKIRQRMANPDYHRFYHQWAIDFASNSDPDKWQQPLYPNPVQVKIRVYATQSTHKTLTSFRQGSMIHVADELFDASHFLEAFRIHTSTSPNYPIIASLDIGRRQAALEGFNKVRTTILLSLQLRQRIRESADLQPYFQVLSDDELIPDQYRTAGHNDFPYALSSLSSLWGQSDFVIDPTRVTLNVSKAGIDGSSFRQLLMTSYDIQVNKTSRHTVLFLINIGATHASIDYLMQVLHEMAAKFKHERRRITPLAEEVSIPLPERRFYHPAFLPFGAVQYQASDIRTAYFEGSDARHTTYIPHSAHTLEQVQNGKQWISASFVTPYPPGFPVIVPGQIITTEILTFFQHIKVKEIHGFSFELGFKVFTEDYLAHALQRRQAQLPTPPINPMLTPTLP